MPKKAKAVIAQYPALRCFLFECTELPPYSDAVRAATGLPVFDAITACDFFLSSRQDNARFGLNDWQEEWDGEQEEYKFGQHLNQKEARRLVNRSQTRMPLRPAAFFGSRKGLTKQLAKQRPEKESQRPKNKESSRVHEHGPVTV